LLIDGKVVLITGASSGIGEATAHAIAHKGGRVILVARSAAKLEKLTQEIIREGNSAEFFVTDLSDPKAVRELTNKVINEIGIPDILINNAGAGRWLTIEETEDSELKQMMALPYFAAFNLTRELLTPMRKRGSGLIINMTSMAAHLVWPGAAGYTAARAAMVAFSKALKIETHGSGIKVTLAMFGKVTSTYWQNNPGSEDQLPKISKYLPTMSTMEVGDALVRAIENNKNNISLPKIFRLLILFNSLMPGITNKILRWGWNDKS
jgi:short-subunit dehydrogenase